MNNRILIFSVLITLVLASWHNLFAQSTANYSFATAANSSLIDMTGSTELIASEYDDSESGLTNIGFTFVFMGNPFTQFNVTSNGLVTLGADGYETQYDLGVSGVPLISPFLSDLATSPTGKVHYKLTGTAPNRILVIEFSDMSIDYGTDTADGTFQCLLYETSGKIEFIYGTMNVGDIYDVSMDVYIGFSIDHLDNYFLSVNTSDHSKNTTGSIFFNTYYDLEEITDLSSASDGSRRKYTFTPPASPNAPTSLTFSDISFFSMTLNWTDNAANEFGYLIERSTDGTNYTYEGTVYTDEVSYEATGLTHSTTYYWRVSAYNEGTLSNWLTGTQATDEIPPPLSGTKTIGPSGADFESITEAIETIVQAGLAGSLILELNSDYTDDNEIFPIVFTGLPSTETNTITLRPAAAATNLDIYGHNYNGDADRVATIVFDNCSYITIDGRAGGSKSGNELTIRNFYGSGDYGGTALVFINGSQHNTIRYCNLKSPALDENGIIYFAGTDNSDGNSYNLIEYCDLRNNDSVGDPTLCCIYSYGNSSAPNTNNTVSYCNIFNFFANGFTSYGIHISGYNSAWTVSNNKFYQESALTFNSTIYGSIHNILRIATSTGSGFNISNNIFGYNSSAGTGNYTISLAASAAKFLGISFYASNSALSTISDNIFRNIAITQTSSTQDVELISILGGMVNVTDNIIGNDTDVSNITVNKNKLYCIKSVSTGEMNISSNEIGSVLMTCTRTTSDRIYCIYNYPSSSTANNCTISNNTIGSTTTANSIRAGEDATSNEASIIGIYSQNSPLVTISGNTIANLFVSTTSSSSGNALTGIYHSSYSANINSNEIYSLSSKSGSTYDISNASILGIYSNGGGSGYTIDIADNLIYNLNNSHATNTVHVYGMFLTSTGAAGTVEGNFIHSLGIQSSGAAYLNGIYLTSSNYNYQNNMIRLGIDGDGNSLTNAININGILKSTTNQSSFYFNSVYIGGTGVGSTTGRTTAAYYSSFSNSGDIIKNNIFVNERSNATTGSSHYAMRVPSSNPPETDYNLYRTSGTGGVLLQSASSDYSTLSSWITAFGEDVHSVIGDPSFINPTGNSADVNLHLTGTTPAESVGSAIDGITDDYDGDVRASLTPTDIGADAGNFTQSDSTPPAIQFTQLTSGGINNRVLNDFAFISDNVGVSSGGNLPRFYFKKSSDANAFVGNTSADNGWKYVVASNSTTPYSFTVDYSIINGGSVSSGNTIQYFVVAQDDANNLASLPSGAAASGNPPVQNINAKPATVYSYTISNYMSGTYNVPGDYASLTRSSGLFYAINNSVVNGDITILITGDITNEDGSYSLNQWSEDSPNPHYTVTIRPADASEKLVSGSITNGIRLYGADRVTIDGNHNSAGRYLRFRNTSGSATFSFNNDASNNTIKNCIFEGSTGSSGVIAFSIVSSTGNDNNTIENNIIRDRSDAASVPSYCIYASTSGSILNSGNQIKNNEIYNFTNYGINIATYTCNEDWTISGNEIYQTAERTAGLIGISIQSSGNNLITQNIIHDLLTSSTSGVYAMRVSNMPNGEISRNKIYNLSTTSGVTGTLYGISLSQVASFDRNFIICNNQITIVPQYNNTQTIYGIYENSDSGDETNVYFNSIYIGGTESAGLNSYGYFRYSSSIASNSDCVLRNNSIVNNRTGGSGGKYCVHVDYKTQFDSDYNFFSGSGTDGSNYFRISSTNYNFANWKTQTSGDGNSWAESISNLTPANFFNDVSTGDLNVKTDQSEAWYLNGNGIPISGYSADYSSAGVRSTTISSGSTDIGSDEFTPSSVPPSATASGPPTLGATTTYTFGGRTVGSIYWGNTGTVPSSIDFKYFPGTNPPGASTGDYGNCYWSIDATGGSGYTYDVMLYYNAACFGTISLESDIRIAKNDGGGWQHYGSSILDADNNTVRLNGLDSFSDFALSSQSSPLPVELISFTAAENNNSIILRWSTATEADNYGFQIERKSFDAEASSLSHSTDYEWQNIGFVEGHGNSNSRKEYYFTDKSINGGGKFQYRLKQIDTDGSYSYSETVEVTVLPNHFELSQNYPNPFNPSTSIKYQVSSIESVSLKVYDILGNEVAVLVNERKEPGYYEVEFNASHLTSGVYFYVLRAGDKFNSVKKMMLLK